MSSFNTSDLLQAIAAMEKQLASLKSLVVSGKSLAAGAAAASSSSGKKEKKERAPTPWRLFTDRVRSLLKENDYEGSSLGVGCIQFCSSLKDENADLDSWSDADILARRQAWSVPEISKHKAAAAASVTSDGDAAPGKKQRKSAWAGLSDEQKAEKVAKMQAGRASAKAAKTAPSEDDLPTDADASADESHTSSKKSAPKKRTWSAEAKASAAAKRAAKKAAASSEDFDDEPLGTSKTAAKKAVMETKKMLSETSNAAATAPLPASPPGSPALTAASSTTTMKKIVLDKKKYWVNMDTKIAHFRLEDESLGALAGIFTTEGGKTYIAPALSRS